LKHFAFSVISFSLQNSKATLTFVFDSVKKSIVASHTTGSFNETQYQECVLQCKNVSNKIFSFYRDIIENLRTG